MADEGVTRRDDIWESAAEAAAEPKEPDTLAIAGVVLPWVAFARRWPRVEQWALIVIVLAVNVGLIVLVSG